MRAWNKNKNLEILKKFRTFFCLCGLLPKTLPPANNRRKVPQGVLTKVIQFPKHFLLHRTVNKSIIMKYRVDAYQKGAVKQGTQLLENIDDAIVLAKKVAMHYKCYTKIARVQ